MIVSYETMGRLWRASRNTDPESLLPVREYGGLRSGRRVIRARLGWEWSLSARLGSYFPTASSFWTFLPRGAVRPVSQLHMLFAETFSALARAFCDSPALLRMSLI